MCGVHHALSREFQAHDAAEASLHLQEGLQDSGNPAGSPQGRCVCPWILSVSKDTPGSWDNALGGHEVTSIWGEKQGFGNKSVDLLLLAFAPVCKLARGS